MVAPLKLHHPIRYSWNKHKPSELLPSEEALRVSLQILLRKII